MLSSLVSNIPVGIKNTLSELTHAIKLQVYLKKTFLYSFLYPDNSIVVVEAYNPVSKTIAEKFIQKIKVVTPKLDVELVGSARLEVPGEKEIDLFITCDVELFSEHLPLLETVLGVPKYKKNKIIQWFFEDSGYMIDIALIDPSTIQYEQEIKVLQVLTSNDNLLEEYRQLKLSLHGKSIREYQQRKTNFFERITK